MGWLSEMSRNARWAEVLLGQRSPEPETTRLSTPMPLPCLDESEIEVFLQYWFAAEKLGANALDLGLQDAINGHPHRIEDAFLCLLEYKDKLEDGTHATNFLCKALREGWKPTRFQSYQQAKKEIPWL